MFKKQRKRRRGWFELRKLMVCPDRLGTNATKYLPVCQDRLGPHMCIYIGGSFYLSHAPKRAVVEKDRDGQDLPPVRTAVEVLDRVGVLLRA
eukprot:COSAG06_NODE_13548_length_1245_cov_10.632635_1_plen_91_part_10